MVKEVFSNHSGGSCELTLVANVKQGFVPVPQPLTYSARLRIHLYMLNAMRRNGQEMERAANFVGPIDLLQTLKSVSWTLMENDTKMLFSVSFDRPLEPYIRRIVDLAGPLLDTILCHCEDFEGHSSDFGFDRFMEFGRKYQIPVEMFVASAPNFSVDDAQYYKQLDEKLRTSRKIDHFAQEYPGFQLTSSKDISEQELKKMPVGVLAQQINLLQVLHENSRRFPQRKDTDKRTSDATLYHRLAWSLVPMHRVIAGVLGKTGHKVANVDKRALEDIWKELIQEAEKTSDPTLSKAVGLLQQVRDPMLWLGSQGREIERTVAGDSDRDDSIQPGLLPPSSSVKKVAFSKTEFRPTHACLLFFEIENAKHGSEFLEHLKKKIWRENEAADNLRFNVSITHQGLKQLGLPDHERIRFPESFRQGMDARAGLLGDTSTNHPKEWKWPCLHKHSGALGASPIDPARIDFVVQVQGICPDAEPFPEFNKDHPLSEAIEELSSREGVTLLVVEPMHRNLGRKDNHMVGHLGFADGVSQPKYAENSAEDSPELPLGDLLLGHPDSLNNDKPMKPVGGILKNGTFQVIRKISLDVRKFRDVTSGDEKLQEKILGRRKDGQLLAEFGKTEMGGTSQDPKGEATPLQSHVRRTNPREDKSPRILRSGFSYGKPYDEAKDEERGLFFIAYNANISEQFEVIQRWVSGGNSTGISSNHGDPILAPKRQGHSRYFHYLDGKKAKSLKLGPSPIGRLVWGLYAFTPSLEGLDALLTAHKSEETGSTDAPLPSSLRAMIEPQEQTKSLEDWRLVLEDADEAKIAKREAIWQYIRNNGGKLQTPYGELVGTYEGVNEVLANEKEHYSVETYGERMKDTVGDIYLGRDSSPEERSDEKPALEEFLNKLDFDQLAQDAIVAANKEIAHAPLMPELGRRIAGPRYFEGVVARLCCQWFGLPEELAKKSGPTARGVGCPANLVVSSFHVFWPHPRDPVPHLAKEITGDMQKSIVKHAENKGTGPNGSLYAFLRQREKQNQDKWTDQSIAEMVLGACFGFAGPTTGSFRFILYDWISTGMLWRLQGQYNHDKKPALLRSAMLESMCKRPAPDLIHRKKKDAAENEHETVVCSIRSAVADLKTPPDERENLLFGGPYSMGKKGHKAHPCPGRELAFAAMTGAFAALFQRSQLNSQGPLTLWARE